MGSVRWWFVWSGLYTWWAPYVCVYSFKFFEPRLLISPSDHSLPLSLVLHQERGLRQGCHSSQTDAQVWRFEDLLRYCSYSLVDFMFFHFCLVDFDRLPLWSGPVGVPLPVSFRSHGINLGFFCWFDWSICLCCAIRFGCVAFNRSIHEIEFRLYPAHFLSLLCDRVY